MNTAALKPFIVVPVNLAGDLSPLALRLLWEIKPHYIVERRIADAYREAGFSLMVPAKAVRKPLKYAPADYTFLGAGEAVSAATLQNNAAAGGRLTPVFIADRAHIQKLFGRYASAKHAFDDSDDQSIIVVRPIPPTQFVAKRVSDDAGQPDLLLTRRLLGLLQPA